MDESIEKALIKNDPEELKSLFSFDVEDNDVILFKFNIWSRHFFPKYFTSDDAELHEQIDRLNLEAYQAMIKTFTDIAFRGAAKTARTKLFLAFCIANDLRHFRKYIKVLCEDGDNSAQIVTDIYNMLVLPSVQKVYPEIFAKTHAKREERMNSFTTSTGIKLVADIVGTGQRGQLQDESRPDLIWFEDFENKKTLRSSVTTNAIWLNMEEARTGLAINGACIYTCNYVSEAGNVHKLVMKEDKVNNILLITPIITNIRKSVSKIDNKNHIIGGDIAWDRYSIEDVDYMFQTDEDFEGERLCQPSASKDVYFDREMVDSMQELEPVKQYADFKIFRTYNPAHAYASGHDVAGGVGLDSSASVFIDFSTFPAQVVATYKDNMIQPEAFGDEIVSEQNRFPGSLAAIENNKYDKAILKAKLLGAKLYMTEGRAIKTGYKAPTTYGWNTNGVTKSIMLSSLKSAVEDGLIALNDKDLIAEVRGYTRNDLIESEPDVRLTTRHFDLLIACAIAWQMKDHAKPAKQKPKYVGLGENKETNPAI